MNLRVAVVRDGDVAVIVLQRPPVNALDAKFVEELSAALDEVDRSDARAILVRAQGTRAFSAGGDIAFIEAGLGDDAEGLSAMVRFLSDLQEQFTRLEAHPLPSVAALDGPATGGGLELALACDLRVAGENVLLGLPEVGIGLIPGAGGTQRLTRIAGIATAKRLILTSELITGAEAATLGIIQYAVPDGSVVTDALALTHRLARQPADALERAKACLADAPSAAGFDREIAATRELYQEPAVAARLREFITNRRKRNIA